MHKLTDYLLAIRTPDSPLAPAGVKTVELVPAEGDDVIASTIGGLRVGGLTAADLRI
jgi:hypothetical protein